MPRQAVVSNARSADEDDNTWTTVSHKKPPSNSTASTQSTRPLMMYRQGMKLGPGRMLPGGEQAIRNLQGHVGEGTVDDPTICWSVRTSGRSEKMLRDCESLIRAETKRLGLTFAVIRGDLHSSTRTRDKQTGELLMVQDVRNPDRQVPLHEPVDLHLTVFLGDDVDDVKLQGHIFVKMEMVGSCSDTSIPTDAANISDMYKTGCLRIKGKLPREKRTRVQDGHGRWSEELYEVGRSLCGLKENHHLLDDLTKQWARLGPYACYD